MKKKLLILILGLTGTWFLKLWWFNQLTLYIIPRYNILVISTGGFCVLVSFVLFLKDSWHWHETKFHITWQSVLLLIIPVFLGFSLKPTTLSNATANQRGTDTSFENFQTSSKSISFKTNSLERNFEDWINILGQSPNPQQYVDETIKISGFLSGTKNEPLLSRFLLRCCAADARAVSFRLKNFDTNNFTTDNWFEITGTIKSDQNDSQPIYIQVNTIKNIDTPVEPYLN